VTTVEAEPIEHTEHEEHNDEEHRVCHLYRSTFFKQAETTMCGIPPTQDWHAHAHQEQASHIWEKGQMSCPLCGAPICVDCLLAAS